MATANPHQAFNLVCESILPTRTAAANDDEPRDFYLEAKGIAEGTFLIPRIPQIEHLLAFWEAIKVHQEVIRQLETRNKYLESDEYSSELIENMLGGEAAGKDYESDL
jgi:hypothetical protein